MEIQNDFTCKTHAYSFAGNCSHHHMRPVEGVDKIWRKSCPLSPDNDLQKKDNTHKTLSENKPAPDPVSVQYLLFISKNQGIKAEARPYQFHAVAIRFGGMSLPALKKKTSITF